MAAGGADVGLKDMEPFQVFEFVFDEGQVEQLSDPIAKVFKRLSSNKGTTSGVDDGHRVWPCCV